MLVAELSGSESVVHFDLNGQTWVSQSHGIHPFEVGSHGAGSTSMSTRASSSTSTAGSSREAPMARIVLDDLRHSYMAVAASATPTGR